MVDQKRYALLESSSGGDVASVVPPPSGGILRRIEPIVASVAGSCPSCGLIGEEPGETGLAGHPASAACWAAYGRLLARSYGDPDRRRVHQMAVDAYVTQHPGGGDRRAVQTVALCLMTLCLFVEDAVDPAEGPALHKAMVSRRPRFTQLAPPELHWRLNVGDVLAAADAAAHRRLVREWGAQVWEAWAPHHATIRRWNAEALGRPAPGL